MSKPRPHVLTKPTFLFLGSALAFAIPPVILAFSPLNSVPLQTTALVMLTQFALALVLLASPAIRRGCLAMARDVRLAGLSALNAILLAGSIYWLTRALAGPNKVQTVLIIESWPVLLALTLPAMPFAATRSLGWRGFSLAMFVLIGVIFVIYPGEIIAMDISALLRIDGTTLMAFLGLGFTIAATIVKAWTTALAHRLYPVDDVDCQVYLQLFFLPVGAGLLAVGGVQAIALTLPVTAALVTVAALYTLSSVLYTRAVLNSRSAAEGLIWYVAPVITIALMVAVGSTPLPDQVVIGAIFIVSCNLLLQFPADTRLSYLGGILTLLAASTFCVLVPGQSRSEFLDIITAGSIFFVVIVAFLLERLSVRASEEMHRVQTTWAEVSSHDGLSLPDRVEALKALNSILGQNGSRVFLSLKRTIRAYRRLGILTPTVLAALNELAFSRMRGATFADILGLMAILLATSAASLAYRPDNLFGDAFASMTVFSMVYLFLSIIDLAIDRRAMRVGSIRSGTSLLATVLPPNRAPTASVTLWTLFIIVVSFSTFMALFARG